MSYIKAEKILPLEIIELIQEYVEGENIYIPKKKGNRQEWGKGTNFKQELRQRNKEIYSDYMNGQSISLLANRYYLSEKSIQRIVCRLKNEN